MDSALKLAAATQAVSLSLMDGLVAQAVREFSFSAAEAEGLRCALGDTLKPRVHASLEKRSGKELDAILRAEFDLEEKTPKPKQPSASTSEPAAATAKKPKVVSYAEGAAKNPAATDAAVSKEERPVDREREAFDHALKDFLKKHEDDEKAMEEWKGTRKARKEFYEEWQSIKGKPSTGDKSLSLERVDKHAAASPGNVRVVVRA